MTSSNEERAKQQKTLKLQFAIRCFCYGGMFTILVQVLVRSLL